MREREVNMKKLMLIGALFVSAALVLVGISGESAIAGIEYPCDVEPYNVGYMEFAWCVADHPDEEVACDPDDVNGCTAYCMAYCSTATYYLCESWESSEWKRCVQGCEQGLKNFC